MNRGTDPEALLDAIPLDRVAYVHVAGGAEHAADPGVYHDTHTDPVPPAVLALLERLRERLDVAPAVMLERDGRYPPAATLHAELDAIAAAAACRQRPRGAARSRRRRTPGAAPPGAMTPPPRRVLRRPDFCIRARRYPARVLRFGHDFCIVHARPDPAADLAARQAELVAALVAGAPDPAGLRPRPARRRPARPAAQAGG